MDSETKDVLFVMAVIMFVQGIISFGTLLLLFR